MTRDTWRSRTGFILAAVGSAIGLANIVKFPYIVGQYGGAAFILLYLFCLFLMGFPLFVAEALIGRTAKSSPLGAFRALGKSPPWTFFGGLIVLTGLVVSAYYSAFAAWILGYLVEAALGRLRNFDTVAGSTEHFQALTAMPLWTIGYHGLFTGICALVLLLGVRGGIERGSKVMMPVLFGLLSYLVVCGLLLDGAGRGLQFLFKPDWSVLTPSAFLVALGQSFFTLSLGQGTVITYGSYLSKEHNLVTTSLPIALADTLLSLMAAVAVFTIVFSAGVEPTAGEGLIFQTLPLVFGQMKAGYILAIFFFLLVSLAALTSQISAMEPVIAALADEWGWKRSRATCTVALLGFIIGIPCALSPNILVSIQLWGKSVLGVFDLLATAVLIPVGGLLAAILVGWRWGFRRAMEELKLGAPGFFEENPWIRRYFRYCICYVAPLLIIVVFAHAVGIV